MICFLLDNQRLLFLDCGFSVFVFFRGIFGIFEVLYSTLLHLPPLRFHMSVDAGTELMIVATRVAGPDPHGSVLF
jgi:hypothetical protein